MKLGDYTRTLGGALKENQLSRFIILGLVVSNLLSLFMAMSKHDIVVMVPPGLSERSELAENQAGAGIKQSWATYVAMMLGNVTPRTAPYLTETLGKVIAPEAYKTLLDAITEQTKVIEDQQVTIQFVPNEVFYLPEKDVVVVSGEFSMRGMRDAERNMVRTYEIGLVVHDYMVQMKSLKVYEGPWTPDQNQKKAAAQSNDVHAGSNG